MTGRTRLYAMIDPVTKSSVPQLHNGVLVDRCNEGIFLLHPDQPWWALTDETGMLFSQLADGQKSISDLATEICEQHHSVSLTTVENDLIDFFGRLRDAHLLASHPVSEKRNPVYREPQRLTIYLTEECNLRCKHCFVVEGKMPRPKLSADDVKKLITSHLKLHPGALVNFTGGEPLLRDDCLELAAFARTLTREVSINTNGHLLTGDKASFLATNRIAVQLSLDGPDPEIHDFVRGKGSWQKVMNALDLLCDAGHCRLTRLSTSLTKCTVEDVERLVKLAISKNLLEARFLILNKMRAADTNWDRINPDSESLKQIYRYLLLDVAGWNHSDTAVSGEFPGFISDPVPGADHWCPIGKTSIYDSQGNEYQCPALLDSGYQISTSGEKLSQAQRESRSRKLRETMKQRRFIIPECVACPWQNFCQGGCQAFTQLRTNSIYVNDEFCDFRRELYRKSALQKQKP